MNIYLLKTLIKNILLKYSTKNNREITKNIFLSFFAKGISLFVSFASVSLLLNYLGKENYGVWLTVFSIISYFSFFDLGLGNGLRNYLTSAFSLNNVELARQYITTAYFILGLFLLITLIIIQICIGFVNWQVVFKSTSNFDFYKIVSICLWGLGLLLLSNLIVSILQSKKKTGFGNLLQSLGGLISLIVFIVFSQFKFNSKLNFVAFIFTWSTPLFLFIFSFFYFILNKDSLMPKLHHFRKALIRKLFGLGLSFFLAQFLVLILNQASNIIITQVLNPSEVVIYSIPQKLYSIVSISLGIISITLLPYYTEAVSVSDYLRIRNITFKFFKFFMIVVLFSLVLLFTSEIIIKFWLGNIVKVPFSLLLLQLILVLVGGINTIFSTVLNGLGKIKIQLPIILIAVIIFIPSAIYLGKKFQLNGIVVASIMAQLPISFFLFFQSRKIISKKNISKKNTFNGNITADS